MTAPETLPVTTEIIDGIALISIDNPPVNALSAAVRGGLLGAIVAAGADASVAAIVLICRGRTFVAGADINEFGKPPVDPPLSAVLAGIEATAKPVIAALHGTALGGGFELALACHHRIAVASAKVGLPEIRLGLIPGGGGTQRLPRLIGPLAALDLIVSGVAIDAARALELGALDAVVDGDDLRGAALGFARARVADPAPLLLARDRVDRIAPTPALREAFAGRRAAIDAGSLAAPATGCAIDAVEAGIFDGFAAGLAAERAAFVSLRDSPNAKVLREAFFASRRQGRGG